MQCLAVLEIAQNMHAIVLVYRTYTPTDGLEGIKWCQHQYHKLGQRPGQSMVQTITATPLEFELLQTLFALNAKLLPSDYVPSRDLYEDKFETSVLLPVGPLTFDALGTTTTQNA